MLRLSTAHKRLDRLWALAYQIGEAVARLHIQRVKEILTPEESAIYSRWLAEDVCDDAAALAELAAKIAADPIAGPSLANIEKLSASLRRAIEPGQGRHGDDAKL